MRKRSRSFKNGIGYTIRRLAVLLIVLLLAVGAVFGIVSLIKGIGPLDSYTLMPFSASDKYVFTGSGFLYLDNDTLIYDDLNDNSKDYSFRVSASEVELSASKTIAALYNSSAVQIVGAQTPIEQSGEASKISAVKCGLDYIAVLFEETDSKHFLKIFDKNAALIDEIHPESDYLFMMDFGFTDTDSNTLWTLLVDTSAEIPICTITTYDLSKKSTTGVMTAQHQLVESLEFTDNSIFAVGTNHLMRYNNGSLIFRLSIYGYKVIDYSFTSSKPVFLLQPRSSDSSFSTVKVCTVSEKETADDKTITIQLPHDTLSAFLMKDKVVACTADTINTYSLSGELLSKTDPEFALTANGAVKLNDSEILLYSGNDIYRYQVK
ncbi:MAG: hypothetical protein IJO48_06005 [Clostridia bacterium]|nr:hypothetical protein [Clostridia bacterium]